MPDQLPYREPTYVSPSSLSLFYRDPTKYFLKYVASVKPEREPQSEPMAAGSAFDAYVKNALQVDLLGSPREGFELRELFESQVENQHWDWAWEYGKYLLDCYQMGPYQDLLAELEQAKGEPEFELKIKKEVSYLDMGPVPFYGFVDLAFWTKDDHLCVIDWKVNGSAPKVKGNTSPKPEYIKLYECWDPEEHKHSIKHLSAHKFADPIKHKNGMIYNEASFFESIYEPWAAQTSIYTWALGAEVGEEGVMIGIDQLVGKAIEGKRPRIRVARHRATTSSEYQIGLFKRCNFLWQQVKKGHLFHDMPYEDNRRRYEALNNYCEENADMRPTSIDWLKDLMREQEDAG